MMALYKLNWIVSQVSSRVFPLSRARVNLDFCRCVLRCARSKVRPVGKCFKKKQTKGRQTLGSYKLKVKFVPEDEARPIIS